MAREVIWSLMSSAKEARTTGADSTSAFEARALGRSVRERTAHGCVEE
jgi:hypothetical protein